MDNLFTHDGKTETVTIDDSDVADAAKLAQALVNNPFLKAGNLTKHNLNENLNFLCGSGTSVTVGGKTVNAGSKPFDAIIKRLEAVKKKEVYVEHLLASLKSSDLLEAKLDRIHQEYLYYENIVADKGAAKAIKGVLDE